MISIIIDYDKYFIQKKLNKNISRDVFGRTRIIFEIIGYDAKTNEEKEITKRIIKLKYKKKYVRAFE